MKKEDHAVENYKVIHRGLIRDWYSKVCSCYTKTKLEEQNGIKTQKSVKNNLIKKEKT